MEVLTLDQFIEKEFGNKIEAEHKKSFKTVMKDFYKDSCSNFESCLGGESSIRVYLKERIDSETVYYYIGEDKRIKLFESEGTKLLDYFRKVTENDHKIDEFLQNHGGHAILIFTLSSIGVLYHIKSKYENKYHTDELDLTNYDF